MRLGVACLLVALSGFIALSYEILWFRVFSFASGGAAPAFATMLGAYLLGIALGARVAGRVCRGDRTCDPGQLRLVAFFVLAGNLAGFASVPLCAFFFAQLAGAWIPLAIVVLVAGLLGAQFPLIAHYGVAADHLAGARISYLYVCNIAGSVSGSLLTGFVLMDHLSLATIAMLLTMLGVLTAAGMLAFLGAQPAGRRALVVVGGLAVVAVLWLSTPLLFAGLFERLQYRQDYAGQRFKHVIETKSGVITVTQDDEVFGGGVYDGVFNLDLVHDRNGLIRPLSLGLVHPAPKRVLLIGLASGSWTAVVANHPGVESVTVVEINPGYLELIRLYPEHAHLLEDPKVEIIIDDGRRWLNRNPGRHFDAIISNTTWHWRDQISNLLSLEFHQLIADHLAPDGVFLFNTTSSERAMRTALEVFPHGLRIRNNLWVSKAPIVLDAARWEQQLRTYEVYDHALFNLEDPRHVERMREILGLVDTLALAAPDPDGLEAGASVRARTQHLRPITDDNMGHEWRR